MTASLAFRSAHQIQDDILNRRSTARAAIEETFRRIERLEPLQGVVERQHVELGAAIEADPGAGQRDFAACIGLRPDRVARSQRRVDDGPAPAGLLLVMEGHGAIDEGKASDPARRIGLSPG